MSFKDRLIELMNLKGVTAYDISAVTGISQSTLSRLKSDHAKKPSLKNLKKLADYFQVSEDWLRNGIGEPFKVIDQNVVQTLNTQEMISRLIVQNDKLIATIERHSITIENLSRKVADME
jgi:transcriptional regulator with XRE-family HTH domain